MAGAPTPPGPPTARAGGPPSARSRSPSLFSPPSLPPSEPNCSSRFLPQRQRQFLSWWGPGRAANARHWNSRGGRTMAEPRGAAKPAPKASFAPTELRLRSAPQPRPSRVDTVSLGRYRGNATASREPPFHGSVMPSGTVSGRRRGALRELLGLQGAAPAGWLSEERPEEQSPGGPNAPSGSGLCLEPREHAWILAAAEGRFEALQELLEVEPGLLLRGDPITGYTVLHWLAKHGRHEELILVHDFAQRRGLRLDVSAPGSGGLTPLHLAALQGHDMVVKVLVGALGADPTRRDHSGHRACHYLRPDAPWSLRELSGAEDWETAGGSERNNANNNSSGGGAACTPRRAPSAVGAPVVETTARAAAAPAKGKDSVGRRVAQIQGLLRHMFPFFQDR
ncbi:ankyrin repeat domain-containing protein SOWAHD [Monodon monoceros]|uniref:Ankyrin repeat domain-containing protein SOWAHD n=2 Tax=Monodontidae TaxID=9747 RepID=A0A2Y9MA94_DELLE|nr:ankyrin repeat domain-containing protein SOWAHD [Delphinapterus leucas]XP_029096708.1 ankyrin repeat domain-containing protein SOWAHD [Monodon monoceros]